DSRMTRTSGIEAHDGHFAFGKKLRHQSAVLAVFLGCLLIGLSALRAQPITSAYSEVHVPLGMPLPASQSNSVQTSLVAGQDTSSNSQIWGDSSRARTSFGFNSAYAESDLTYIGQPGFNPGPTSAVATASCVLSWSTLDHSSSGNILNLSLSLSN